MYEPEGPLPPRPHRSGVGGPSINQGGAPPPVTSVWSASDAAANGMTLSNGGLTVTPAATGWQSVRTTTSKTTGKFYIEFLVNVAPTGTVIEWGLASSSFNPVGYLGATNFSGAIAANQFNQASTGFTSHYNIPAAVIPPLNDVWALAVDFDAGSIWIAQNNVWSPPGIPGRAVANPATATSPIMSFVPATVGALFAGMSLQGTSGVWTLQPTAASQKYAPPAGFSAWG